MGFLDPSMVKRPWSNFIRLSATDPNALDVERGKLSGGTYMAASPAVEELRLTFVGMTTIDDKYLGACPGQRWMVTARPQPWTKLLEPVDYVENIRLHSVANWANSRLERRRHTARLIKAWGNPQVRDLVDEVEGQLQVGFATLYDELFHTYAQYADYSMDTFTAWLKEHRDSSSGKRDAFGRSLTWGRVLEMDETLKEAYTDIRDAVKAFVAGYDENSQRVLSHDFAWDPHVTFRALRNRPETSFTARGAEGKLFTSPAQYLTKRYRDRAAGGIKVLSWIFAFIPKESLHDYVGNALKKAIDTVAPIGCPYSGPIWEGLDSYIRVLTTPADKKAYIDMSNCEKFAGSIGYSIGRVAFRGTGEQELWQSLCELSGHALTTEDNILTNMIFLGWILNALSIYPDRIEIHGDNVCLIGVSPDTSEVIEEFLSDMYTSESIWLGHGVDRVVGLKFSKDSKGNAIAMPPDYRVRPQTWHYGPDKLGELTSTLLCRDVIYRHFNGPKYTDVLKQMAQRSRPQDVERLSGRWNGLAETIELWAQEPDFQDTIAPSFADCMTIVSSNLRKLVH